jgi:hypothetical protein
MMFNLQIYLIVIAILCLNMSILFLCNLYEKIVLNLLFLNAKTINQNCYREQYIVCICGGRRGCICVGGVQYLSSEWEWRLHCKKKVLWFSRPQPGCHLPNSPWSGIINPARESLISDILPGNGKIDKLFYSVDLSKRRIEVSSL